MTSPRTDRWCLVVPVKRLAVAKTRLSGLSAQQRGDAVELVPLPLGELGQTGAEQALPGEVGVEAEPALEAARALLFNETLLDVPAAILGPCFEVVQKISRAFESGLGADGSFTIANLPAGTYTIEVWHETLGTHEASVTIGDGESKTQDFTLRS